MSNRAVTVKECSLHSTSRSGPVSTPLQSRLGYFKPVAESMNKADNAITQAIQVTTQMDSLETEKCELEGLQEAMTSYGLKTGLILTENTDEQRGDISIVPIWKWLLGD